MFNLDVLFEKLSIPHEHVGRSRNYRFDSITALDNSNRRSLVFINKSDKNTLKILRNINAAIVVMERMWSYSHINELKKSLHSIIIVDNPRLAIARVMTMIYPEQNVLVKGVHRTAIIDPEAKINPSVSIGAYCIIGKCKIGEKCQIDAYTKIYDGTIVGNRVTIRDHCSIGGTGFGFVRDQQGRPIRVPHIGGVVIEDDVDIFPFCNIDRAMLNNTLIKKGTVIDHFSHIGHNTEVGENTIITAGTVLCGGSCIGDESWIGVGSIVKEKVIVGNKVTTGLGAVIVKPVKDGSVVAGVPAKTLKKKSDIK